MEIYSTNNEENYAVAERFIRTLKNRIYKYMTSVSKNDYIDKLDDTVNKYNNTYYRTIKMKPIDVKSNTYIDSSKETNNKSPKFKIRDIVIISKYKNMFANVYGSNQPKDVFVIKKVKNTVLWTYVISDLKSGEIAEMFYEKEKHIKNNLELKK